MNNNDVRWKQRFQNFEKAFLRLKEAAEKKSLNELEKNGLIHVMNLPLTLRGKS